MTHWIIETMVYEIVSDGVVVQQLYCGKRVSNDVNPGIWMTNGTVELGEHDSFSSYTRSVDRAEYIHRCNDLRDHQLTFRVPFKEKFV